MEAGALGCVEVDGEAQRPAFDEEAARKWDPKRYYEDPTYYLAKDLVKPYRIGMSCAFCHVGPDPTKPPGNPEHPEWKPRRRPNQAWPHGE